MFVEDLPPGVLSCWLWHWHVCCRSTTRGTVMLTLTLTCLLKIYHQGHSHADCDIDMFVEDLPPGALSCWLWHWHVCWRSTTRDTLMLTVTLTCLLKIYQQGHCHSDCDSDMFVEYLPTGALSCWLWQWHVCWRFTNRGTLMLTVTLTCLL